VLSSPLRTDRSRHGTLSEAVRDSEDVREAEDRINVPGTVPGPSELATETARDYRSCPLTIGYIVADTAVARRGRD
jgi:hypothetical protein